MAIFDPAGTIDIEPVVNRTLATTSVADIMAQALPNGTTVLAGRSGLGRDVTWASRLRSAPPAFDHLSGGELVLLPPKVLENLDENLTLDEAIRQLARHNVSAIALSDRTSTSARALADDLAIPLLGLPAGIDFGGLERNTARYISERRREILRRGQEAGRLLMDLAIAGESLSSLAEELARLAVRAVVFEGRDGRLLAFNAATSGLTGTETERLLTMSRNQTAGWLRSVAMSSTAEPPSASFALDSAWVRIVAPVSGRDGLLGSVSLLVPVGSESVDDGVLVARGAAACAVILTREQAALNARREIELNVLDEILDGALRSEVSLLQQVKRLGHDLTRNHATIIARVDPAPGTTARVREGRWSMLEEGLHRAARARSARILWRIRNAGAEIVWPTETDEELTDILATVQTELNAAVAMQASTEVVSLGVGRIMSGLEGIRQSHNDARQALTIGRRLHGPGSATMFDQLGVYRLIYAAEHLPELRTFQEEALAPLLTYDRTHGAELIKTLEAFFAANCSPKEAATLLHVHRNTVLYRLERITEITGLDLNEAEVRLRLHLALHVRLALSV